MRVIEYLLKTVRTAAVYNPEVQVAPACILWPDRDRQWEAVIPWMQAELPELLILGGYAPDRRTGPAIWLRCALAGKAEELSLPGDHPPIIYLPGVSRQDLRAVENCPDHLKPLAELQYRGVIWSQINAKDWTILAYLKSDQGGLGLDVAQDNDAKSAMQLALYRLLDEEVDLLKGKRLDKDYFNTLLTGGDPIRDLLQWLDQGDAFRTGRGDNEWKAFVEVCKSQLAFNPHTEGVLAGAAKLATQEGPWRAVWERFCEAPQRYPSIPAQIRKCRPPSDTIFWHLEDDSFIGWPQWNENQEKGLHRELLALGDAPAHEARKKLLELEKKHGNRRNWVWAELGEASLSCALEHLIVLAEITNKNLAAGTVEDLVNGYCNYGWKADDAVIRALAKIESSGDFEAVTTALRSIYLPWIEESARHLQKIIDGATYPGGTCLTADSLLTTPGDCILFVDGLRFDTGKRLVDMLEKADFDVTTEIKWAALPSVTATGKAAVTPVKEKIQGKDGNTDFEPAVAESGQSLKGGYHLRKLLTEAGWIILEHTNNGKGKGKAWCEFGDIDHEGHDRGWRIAKHVDTLLREIRDRIRTLIAAGWKRVLVVTDHGWLLMPGGLPKIDLPGSLTDTKWGRCAAIKPGVAIEERLFSWYWNPHHYFALADGVSCYRNGEEYSHGGLSLQECLLLQITISLGTSSTERASIIEVTDIAWRGLRCTVAVDGKFSGMILDVRTEAGNPSSSVILNSKPFKKSGTASVVVEDEEKEGFDAFIVLTDEDGTIVSQVSTIIGGEKND